MSMTEEEVAAAQAREYGTYVATQPIYVRGARAYNTGEPVSASAVEAGVIPKDAVAKVGTKAADAATGVES